MNIGFRQTVAVGQRFDQVGDRLVRDVVEQRDTDRSRILLGRDLVDAPRGVS
jgi:hypothetical protein